MEWLRKAGILETKTRLNYALANVEHECGGFTIANLTENINYTHARMRAVWPNRFGSSAAVAARYGTGPGWQKRAFDDIYGNRMGNRKGTSDGSKYIGRGGPQITGRDGYKAVGSRVGLDLEANPELATRPEVQPALLAGFWMWKGLNRYADRKDWVGCVRAWNGGTNGMADRNRMMAGNDPIISRLGTLADVRSVTVDLPLPDPARKPPVTAPTAGAGAIIAGGGAAAKQAVDNGRPGLAVFIAVAAVVAAFVIFMILRRR